MNPDEANALRKAFGKEASDEPEGPREHSASSIALAKRCRHAWALRYVEGWKPVEVPWSVIADWELTHGQNWWFSPTCEYGGQRGAALGKEVHLRRELYLTQGADAVEWDDLPGLILQSIIDHLPRPGSVPVTDVEHEFTVELCGVMWKGLIDSLGGAGDDYDIDDLKTTKDIAAYALLPDAAAEELGCPERAMSKDLQVCIYVAYRSVRTLAREQRARWLYTETGKVRRTLPVLQTVDAAQALQVVADAAKLARECETYRTAADAPPDPMRCDDYGGCWQRGRQCFARRPWGRLMRQWERTEEQPRQRRASQKDKQHGSKEGIRRGEERGREGRRQAGQGKQGRQVEQAEGRRRRRVG